MSRFIFVLFFYACSFLSALSVHIYNTVFCYDAEGRTNVTWVGV